MKVNDFNDLQKALSDSEQSIMDGQRILSNYSEDELYNELAKAFSAVYKVRERLRQRKVN
jgi:hypothetical protein